MSAVLIAMSAGLVFAGWQLWRFQALEGRAQALLAGEYWTAETLVPLFDARSELQAWAETPGVRSRARQMSLSLTQAMSGSPAQIQREAASVLMVSPVDASAWMSLATASWAASNPALAYEAWKMSSLVAPREMEAVKRRLAFLLAIWPEAPDELKRQFFYQLRLMLSLNSRFGWEWYQLIQRVPAQVRKQVEADGRAYGPPRSSP